MIIGVVGKAGSGKDTIADMLVKNNNMCKMAFADPLKRICKELFNFTDEQLWGPSEKRSEPDFRYKRYTDNGLEYLNARTALQKIGTEGARFCYENIWVEYTIRQITKLLSSDVYRYSSIKGVYSVISGELEMDGSKHPTGVVVSDCRFYNEIIGIKNAGGIIIKINRSNSGLNGLAAAHQSETEQDLIPDAEFNYVIDNNSTLSDLEFKISNIINLY
jgi:hypothetical protein